MRCRRHRRRGDGLRLHPGRWVAGARRGIQHRAAARPALPAAATVLLAPALPPRWPDAPTRPELHRWRARDGLNLSGWLFRPAGALGAVPTLLWLHGGPEAQERPVFQPLFQALLAQGIAVFAPNVRGSSGFGAAVRQRRRPRPPVRRDH